jgi:hypothetical protein
MTTVSVATESLQRLSPHDITAASSANLLELLALCARFNLAIGNELVRRHHKPMGKQFSKVPAISPSG